MLKCKEGLFFLIHFIFQRDYEKFETWNEFKSDNNYITSKKHQCFHFDEKCLAHKCQGKVNAKTAKKNGERELNEMPAKMFKENKSERNGKNWQHDYAFRNEVVYRTEYFMNFHLDLHLESENERTFHPFILFLSWVFCFFGWKTRTIKTSTSRARTRS